MVLGMSPQNYILEHVEVLPLSRFVSQSSRLFVAVIIVVCCMLCVVCCVLYVVCCVSTLPCLLPAVVPLHVLILPNAYALFLFLSHTLSPTCMHVLTVCSLVSHCFATTNRVAACTVSVFKTLDSLALR